MDQTEGTPGMLPRQLRANDGDNTIDEQDSAFLVSSPGGSSFEFVDAFEHMAEARSTTGEHCISHGPIGSFETGLTA